MEVRPRKARRRAAARDAGTQFGSHDRTANNSAKMLVVGNPVRFHVLDLVAVGKHHLVKLRRVQDREVEGSGTVGDLGNQIHTGLELVAQRRDNDRADDSTRVVSEDTANQVRTRNARETHTLVTAHIHLAYRIRAVGAVAVRKRILTAHDLAATQIAAGCGFNLVERQHFSLRNGRHVIRTVTAVTGVMLAVQVVIDTFAPEEGLVHHPVTFSAVQFGSRAVSVLVAVRIVQRVVGHLTVQVVHRRVNVRHGHATRCRFLRHFGKHPVTLG